MKYLLSISLSLLLSGCASVIDAVSKTAQVLMDPSVPVGAPADQPTMISLSLYATPDVNPNPYREPDVTEPAEPATSTPDIAYKPVHNTNLVIETDPIPTAADQIAAMLAQSGKQPDEEDADTDPEATPVAFKIIQLKDQSLLLQADYDSLFSDIEQALGTTYLQHDDYVLLPDEFSFIEPAAVAEHTRYIGVTAAYHDYDAAEWKAIIKIQPMGHMYALFAELGKHTITLKKQEQ
ncbi:MAG: type VI secretion system lipoprotein TssJ [Pseudomonadota bacterium]